jgi:hypothetical protein
MRREGRRGGGKGGGGGGEGRGRGRECGAGMVARSSHGQHRPIRVMLPGRLVATVSRQGPAVSCGWGGGRGGCAAKLRQSGVHAAAQITYIELRRR